MFFDTGPGRGLRFLSTALVDYDVYVNGFDCTADLRVMVI